MIAIKSQRGHAYHLQGVAFEKPVYKYIKEAKEIRCYSCGGSGISKGVGTVYNSDTQIYEFKTGLPCNKCEGTGVYKYKQTIDRIIVRNELRYKSLCGTSILRKPTKGNFQELDEEDKEYHWYVCNACKLVKKYLNAV